MRILKVFETYYQDRKLVEDYLNSLKKSKSFYPHFGFKIEKIIYSDNRNYDVIEIELEKISINRTVKLETPKVYIDQKMLDFLKSMIDISEQDILEILKDFIERDINLKINPKISLLFKSI